VVGGSGALLFRCAQAEDRSVGCSQPRPFFLPLSTNVLEGEFSEVGQYGVACKGPGVLTPGPLIALPAGRIHQRTKLHLTFLATGPLNARRPLRTTS
jgi:hypothetical protein